ncbi:MAG: hypothetical protein NT173_08525 [Opitutales bacterium]|nr:hypothetical protein [Opitutales bacterium]
MSMFDTVGTSQASTARKPSTLRKVARMNQALRHEQPDRVPISDFFWGGFTRRWRQELGLPADANPYYHYDLDWIVTLPNMDPWIRPFTTLSETQEEVVVKTGFGAVMHKHFDFPMPEMRSWDTDTFEKLEQARFDDPRDPRRFFSGGDNQLAGVGDGFERNSPPWLDTVKSLWPDFAVYGSMIEVSECLTRLVGQGNALLWMGEEPERMGAVINRIGAHLLACAEAEIAAADGRLDGFVIWGDVAYKQSLLFSPTYWREYFKPWVTRIAAHAHAHGLPVIYHGCGNVRTIFQDCARPAPPARPRHRVLRQQRRAGLGDGRPRRHPAGGAAQAQRREGRRLHLHVRPLGEQRRLGRHLRLHREARARGRPVSAAPCRI